MKSRMLIALGSGLLLGVAGAVNADTTPSNAELQGQIEQLKAKVNELEGNKSQDWLNEQRAAEVKAMVKDVLADADTRASLMANGMTAGHNGQHFFLASENNDFLLNIGGLVQARYDYDHRRNVESSQILTHGGSPVNLNGSNGGNGPSDSNSGFEVARMELDFSGHVVNPSWTYAIRLEQDRESDGLYVPMAWIGYQVTDTVNLRVGRYKGIFMRESLVDDMYQLAADRSVTEGVFGEGYVQGLTGEWDVVDMVHLKASVDNGPHSGDGAGNINTLTSATVGGFGYENTGTNVSVTGRADVKVLGDWKEETGFAAFSDEETALFIGGAINYTQGQTGNIGTMSPPTVIPGTPPIIIPGHTILGGGDNYKDLRMTTDIQGKMAGPNLSGAFVYDYLGTDKQNPEPSTGGVARAGEWFGYDLQGGYMIVPDKFEVFGRYEWLDLKANNPTSLFPSSHPEFVTAGANYYVARHRVKVTLDATYVLHGIPASLVGTGVGNTDLLAASSSDQVTIRGQVQLIF